MSRPPTAKKNWLAHYSGLIGTWAKGSGNVQDAEDSVQDAAERMLGADTLAIRDSRAYLHRSAVNGLVSQYRRENILSASPLHELAEEEHPAIDDVESAVYVAQLSTALSEALEDLPLVCQQVFAWHRIENWTVPEIAQHMGLSVSSVEKHLTRTMRHLRQRLQKFTS